MELDSISCGLVAFGFEVWNKASAASIHGGCGLELGACGSQADGVMFQDLLIASFAEDRIWGPAAVGLRDPTLETLGRTGLAIWIWDRGLGLWRRIERTRNFLHRSVVYACTYQRYDASRPSVQNAPKACFGAIFLGSRSR